MKYILSLYVLFISHLYAESCEDVTNLNDNDLCTFKIEISEAGRVVINPSFDLLQYDILYTKAVKINSQGNEVAVYDGEGRPDFKQAIEILHSASNPSSPITILNGGDKFQIINSGHYRIRLKSKNDGDIHWEQWVYVPYPEPANARALAEKYLPIIAFGDNERYFPRRIEDILSYQSNSGNQLNFEIKIDDFAGGTHVSMGQPIIDFLTNKGGADFLIDFPSFGGGFNSFLKQDTNSIETNLVTYYQVMEKGDFIYLSYYYLYSYDPKYKPDDSASFPAAHAFDREGLIITLNKQTQEPLAVTYGSHIASTPSQYLGCQNDDLNNCLQVGSGNDIITTINDAKVKLNWDLIPKQGDHLIAYAAKGSHALFPAYGWYRTITKEFAGNIDGLNTKIFNPANLIKIDNTSVFAFSGYWVDVAGSNNAKFPPFIRYPDHWTPKPNTVSFYDTCLSGGDTSDPCIRLKKYFPPNKIVGAPIILGDANHDGGVNVLDLSAIINIILHSPANTNSAADCNQDGKINVLDLSCVINLILNGTVRSIPPPLFPS